MNASDVTARAIEAFHAGRVAEALDLAARGVSLAPRDDACQTLLGELLTASGRLEPALQAFRAALAIRDDVPRAWIGRGIALTELGRGAEACADLERAVGLAPDEPELRILLARVLLARGDAAKARSHLDAACRLSPAWAEARLLNGVAAERLGDRVAALAEYEAAVRNAPDHAPALVALANALADVGHVDRAREVFTRVTQLERDHPLAWLGIGLLEHQRGASVAARTAFERALAQGPDALPPAGLAAARSGVLECSLQLCDWSDHRAQVDAVVGLAHGGAPVGMGALLAACDDPPLLLRAANAHAAEFSAVERAATGLRARDADERIRVAYLSADFRTHPVAALAVGIFEQHDPARFEVAAFSLAPGDGSELRARLERAFPTFVDVGAESDAAIAERIARFGADVVVDLQGLTTGSRLGILARRPAAVIAAYHGYAGAMGRIVDYTIADRRAVPPAGESGFAEALAFLPHSFQPNDDRRTPPGPAPTRVEAGLPAGGFVFCCFNHPWKITPRIFDAWMAILRRVPGSVLWLPASGDAVAHALAREAERRGVAARRLVFAARLARHEHHLARLRCADLFLDTHPYNAHATASDALWAGLPVLTLEGRAFHARVAASLLATCGLGDLVVDTLDAYVATAVTLAHDADALADVRGRAARARSSSPLFDTRRTCRALEACYAHMAHRARAGLAPATFEVEETSEGYRIRSR